MPKATAIVIGVGDGPALRRCHLRPLPHSESGAEAIAGYAERLGYRPVTKLIGPDASLANVQYALEQAIFAKEPWDTVLLVFSGHGYQKDSGLLCENGGKYDEHWCLHDDLLVDDHLLQYTQKFDEKTRLFIVADCCFAGEGGGVVGLRFVNKLMRAASAIAPRWFTPPTEQCETAVKERRAWLQTAGFDCSAPKAQYLLIGASDTGRSEAGRFMRAFRRAWDQHSDGESFRTFLGRVGALGGKPVPHPKESPLLDAPAFVP